ncbi:hypothetical protein [Methyloferula stellata]|uniref:hypothetical protein n=1 Tax=Methyloferula stellata TaxID=876270 RepID=UPI000379BBBC|nr:hypothetical protein [Methyloferula stellata]
MAGLYEGVEEIPFKKIDGGYVFQANNAWFFGPKQRFFVSETQKLEIAACIKETMRRIKPFVFVAMVLIPLLLLGGTLWFALQGGTLNVTLTDASGKVTSYSQSIGSTGSSGSVAGPTGTSVLFHVNAPPGNNTTITYARVDASGKIGVPSTVAFASGSTKLNLTDSKGGIFNSATFVGRIGATPGTIMLDAMLLGLALFVPYIGAIHVYSMRRLRPLIAELPLTDARITLAEGTKSFAAKISVKLLAVMGLGGALAFAANAINLIEGLLANRPLAGMEMVLFGLGMSGLAMVYPACLIILRMRAKRAAA